MKTILLIEDDISILENTQELLQLADYKVASAENGKAGVELAKTLLPDLILCDIIMPELDGYGVIKILGKNPQTSKIPFIFLTAKSDKADFRKGMNLGADDYLTKPFLEAELLDAVECRLRHSEVLKQYIGSGLNGLNGFIDGVKGIKNLQMLSNDRKIKCFRKKEEIFRQNDYANYLYLIVTGKVKCIRIDSYGKIIVNDIHGPNSFIGYMTLLDDGEYHETAIAMEDTEVAIIPKSDFLELIRTDRDVANQFIKMLANDVQEREKRLLQLAYSPVRERVASALLMLKGKLMQEPGNDEIKISRDDLASVVGTAKESLIRILSEIKKDGLIETDGLSIRVLNEPGLKRISGE